LSLLVLLGAAGLAHAQVTIVNASFEQYAKPLSNWSDPGNFDLNLDPGNTNITGWTVINGRIDYIGAGWQAADGVRSVDLAGSPGSGGVSQTFATVPGFLYVIAFAMSGNPDRSFNENPLKTLRIQAAGQSADFSYDIFAEGNSVTDMRWRPREFRFTATAATTTLEIFSTMPTSQFSGAAIDNITISAVPEPATVAATAAAGAVVAGLAARYRRKRRRRRWLGE
jgi:choice-of-anchor C domain-containing protein